MHALERFVHREVLMVSREDFRVLGEQNEVLQDVDEPLLGEHAVQRRLPIGVLGGLVASIDALPLNEARLVGGDCANLGVKHVTGDAEGVVHEKRWNLSFVVLNLLVGIFAVSVGSSGRLQFKENERKTVNEYDDIWTFVGAAFDVGPLVNNVEAVLFGIAVIDQAHDVCMLFFAVKPACLHTVLQHVHKDAVPDDEVAALDFF